jgi:uncharacterized protein YbaR (Trm112 family)
MMALSKELLAIIVCPRCKGELVYREEIGALDCSECCLRYSVEEGIPVLIADKARPIEGS